MEHPEFDEAQHPRRSSGKWAPKERTAPDADDELQVASGEDHSPEAIADQELRAFNDRFGETLAKATGGFRIPGQVRAMIVSAIESDRAQRSATLRPEDIAAQVGARTGTGNVGSGTYQAAFEAVLIARGAHPETAKQAYRDHYLKAMRDDQ